MKKQEGVLFFCQTVEFISPKLLTSISQLQCSASIVQVTVQYTPHTIPYSIYIRINVRYVPYLSSVPYVLSDTVFTHITITTPGCTVLTPYTVGLTGATDNSNQPRNIISRSGNNAYSVRCDGYTPVKTDISRLLSHQSTSKRSMSKHSRPLSPRIQYIQ